MSQDSKRLELYTEYNLIGSDLHLLVENKIFRVHSHFFVESPHFRKRLIRADENGNQVRTKDGASDDSALVIQECTAMEMSRFLWVFYNPLFSIYDAPTKEWVSVLKLAHRYDFPQVKALAIRELDKKPELQVADKIALYQVYEVDENYLVPLFTELCMRDEYLSIQEYETLGGAASYIISNCRDRIRSQQNGCKMNGAGMNTTDINRIILSLLGSAGQWGSNGNPVSAEGTAQGVNKNKSRKGGRATGSPTNKNTQNDGLGGRTNDSTN